MKRHILVSLALASCASVPPAPELEVQWKSDQLIDEIKSGHMSQQEVEHRLKSDKHECLLEAMKVSIPSPSCTQRSYNPGVYNTGNSIYDSYRRGAAAASAAYGPDCDYSSVEYAHRAQEQIFYSCMSLRNWEDIWIDKKTGKKTSSPVNKSLPG